MNSGFTAINLLSGLVVQKIFAHQIVIIVINFEVILERDKVWNLLQGRFWLQLAQR